MEKQLGLDDLVFTSVEGKPVDPCVVSHTFASLMLLRGAKPKVISEALGHSSVAFTMDCYSHIIEGMQEDAMALLDEVLPAGVSQRINAKLTPIVNITASRT
jgi:integrase